MAGAMRHRASNALTCAVAGTLVACGGFSNAEVPVATYAGLVNSADRLVSAHASAAEPDCSTEITEYRAELAGELLKMERAATVLDRCFDGGAHGAIPFMAACTGMRSELERHARDACTSADRDGERARHAAEMVRWLDSEYATAQRIRGMLGRGEMKNRCDDGT